MSAAARVEALLSRLSLRRKAAQMVQAERLHITPDQVRELGVGSVLSGGGSVPGANRLADWIAMHDAYWTGGRCARDDDGAPGGASADPASAGDPDIPILYGVDAVHGHNNVRGATVFPHNIGLGAANDPALTERVARATARELLASSIAWTFAPAASIARDPRWGRTYESFSEDPAIVAAHAAASVRGLHGEGVLGCPKHWIGDGGTTDGVDQGDTALSEAELRRTHLPPYVAALDAGARTIMVSLSSWNGVPCHAHRYLITDLLKGELGFDGLVVSDWNGLLGVARDFGEAVVRSVNAGIDLFMVPEQWKRFIDEVVRQVERGRITESRMDDAVRRILRVKEACGLFDAPRPRARPRIAHARLGSVRHRALAREAVAKSVVLLKNEAGLLPLDRDARILVTGRLADDRGAQCGGWTLEWQGVRGNDAIEGGTSIWEGIAAVAPSVRLASPGGLPPVEGFDAAVVVIGERPYAEGCGDIRAWDGDARSGDPTAPGGPASLEPYADSLRLARMHPEDLAAIRALDGLPVVAVLVSGRPLVVEPELAASGAFAVAWLPGSEGAGVADVLFGERPCQGRLAHAWPAADVARDEPARTRFPVGYGLTTQTSGGGG